MNVAQGRKINARNVNKYATIRLTRPDLRISLDFSGCYFLGIFIPSTQNEN